MESPFILIDTPRTLAEAKQRVTELEQHIAQFRAENQIVFVDGVLVCLCDDIQKVPEILDEHARLLHLLDVTGAWLHKSWEE